MIRLVVETPLADDQVRARVLDALDHVLKLLLLVLAQLLVLLNARDVELVLRLGPWRLEWTREDGKLGVAHSTGHLRVRHVLVDEDTADELGVCERAADLAVDLDEVEGHVFALEVCNSHHGLHCDLGEVRMVFRHTAHLISTICRDEKQDGTFDMEDTYILLPKLVMAVLRRLEVSSLEYCTRSDIWSRC